MSTAGAAAGAAQEIIQAARAMGVIVTVDPSSFLGIVQVNKEPLVVHAKGGFFSANHHYLTSYRGLAFFTKHAVPLRLPEHCLLIEAKRIWIPGG